MCIAYASYAPSIVGGQSLSALPEALKVNLFRDRNRIVDFDTQIANCAFDFGVTE